jgi:hypothetical protein
VVFLRKVRTASGATAAQIARDQNRRDVVAISARWRRLGFYVVADEAFFQLVLARLVEPTSMNDAVRVLSELGVIPAHGWSLPVRRCLQGIATAERSLGHPLRPMASLIGT